MSQEAAFRHTFAKSAGSMPGKGPDAMHLEGDRKIAPDPQEDAALELLCPPVCQKSTPGGKECQPSQRGGQAVRPVTKQPAKHSSWDTFIDGAANNGASSCRQGQNSERWDGSTNAARHDNGMIVTTLSDW